MKLVLFVNRAPGATLTRVGVLVDEHTVADVTAAFADAGAQVASMRKFLELGAEGRKVAELAVKEKAYHRPRELVTLRAPIYDPCVAYAG
jgi:hypothetical protein